MKQNFVFYTALSVFLSLLLLSSCVQRPINESKLDTEGLSPTDSTSTTEAQYPPELLKESEEWEPYLHSVYSYTPRQIEIEGTEQSATYYYFNRFFGVVNGDIDRENNQRLERYANADRFSSSKNLIPLIMNDSVEKTDLLDEYLRGVIKQDLVDSYSASFFESKVLLLLTFWEGTDIIYHIPKSVNATGGHFEIVVESHAPKYMDGASIMSNCAILMEIDRSVIESCTLFNAWRSQG